MTSPATPLPRSVADVEIPVASQSKINRQNKHLKAGCADVLGVQVDALDMPKALARIHEALTDGRK